MSIVVFVNPRSRANLRDPGLADRFSRVLGSDGRVLATPSLEALAVEARRLAADPPALIGIHGGDGTLHRTVDALIRAFATTPDRPLPPIAILTGGTMNVVASSLGLRAPPERVLAGLVEEARAGRAPAVVQRRCLKIAGAYGFVFGNGFIANFLEVYYARGGYGARRALWILARTFFSGLIWGRYARRIFGRFRGRVVIDDAPLKWTALAGLAAGTVREVGMGFKLNHRADEDPNRFSVVAIHGGPLGLAMELPRVRQGRGISSKRAYNTLAQRLVVETDPESSCCYTIDGDLYRAAGPLEIALGPVLRFVKPPIR